MKRYIRLLLVFSLLLSCGEKKDNVLYHEPKDGISDPTVKWLNDKNNFHKGNYRTVFYDFYTRKIKEKDFKSAADVLRIVSVKIVHFSAYDKDFEALVHSFSEKYADKLPPDQTTFLASYLGCYETEEGNFKKAIDYFRNITAVEAVDYQSCVDKAYAYFDISFCYFSIGDQNLALENSLKSLHYFNKTDNLIGIGGVYSNLASINMALKNYKKGEEYYTKSIAYFTIAKDTGNIFTAYYNRIQNFEESHNPRFYALIDSTYHLFKESKFKDSSLKISINTYYTKKLLEEGRIAEAKKILDELRPEVTSLNTTYSTQEYDIALAEYEIKKKEGIVDINKIKNAIPALEENSNYQILQNFYTLLKEEALSQKKYEQAFYYQTELQKASDSLASTEIKNKALELNAKYQAEKKEQQIKLQEKTILNKNTTIALLFSTLIGILLFVLAISLRRKQKQLRLEKQAARLYTRQLLEKTEEERRRIASDLHDSVSHELLSLKNTMEGKTDLANTKIDAIINDIRIISRNLHPVMFDKIGLKNSVEQLVERTQSVNSFMVTADINYHSSLSVPDELQVYRIIQEALSNIIKYADAVAAKITIAEENNTIHIEIKDNGKGFNVTETLAGMNAFGLHNIIERTRAIGGEAKITSDKNGTIVRIEIKKS
ncbi:ATP-binding protein [Flavobacterium humi]|nr:ATP-binding protein [Flavobacterium humi]